MDHEAALHTHAVDRYLQAEMTETERDEFEDHYFSCVICADEVRAGFFFKENAKVVLREPLAERQPWWRLPFLVPAFTTVALAAVVLFQNAITLPALRAPQSLASVVILDGATRDSLPRLTEGEPLRFQMAADPAPAGAQLLVELVNDSGAVLRSGKLPAPAPNHPLDVFFPGRLDAGRYAVVIRAGDPRTEIVRNLFRVVKENPAK